jgi:hypothetical protein
LEIHSLGYTRLQSDATVSELYPKISIHMVSKNVTYNTSLIRMYDISNTFPRIVRFRTVSVQLDQGNVTSFNWTSTNCALNTNCGGPCFDNICPSTIRTGGTGTGVIDCDAFSNVCDFTVSQMKYSSVRFILDGLEVIQGEIP